MSEAVELATTYVSVAVSTKNLGKDLIAGTRGLGSAFASLGKQSGTSFSSAFQGSSKGATKPAQQESQALAKVVQSTTAKVKTARDAEASAARKVGIEEAKLGELREKGNAKASQILAAEDRVANARAKHAVATERVTVSVGNLEDAQRNLRAATAQSEQAATSFGGKLRNAFSGNPFANVATAAKAVPATFGQIVSSAQNMGRSVGASAASAGAGIGDAFRKVASGDVRGAFESIKGVASNAVQGVGSVFGKIVPAVTGVVGKVRGVFSGLAGMLGRDGASAGKQFSDGAASEMSAGGTRAGGMFRATLLSGLAVNALTGALKSITGAIGGAFKGGWDRLMNIEQAESKLKTLGMDVKASMASVNQAVDGTRFAISDAADMAAQLGAAGISAGQDMTRWLKLTADAAQFAGVEFSEMQPLMQEIAAQGRVTGEHLNRFPLAASALSKSLGVSQEEVRKLASQGQISAEQFAAAMEGQIGGAAQNAGTTFKAMAANVKTAMNAAMANLLEPFKNLAMPLMGIALGVGQGIRDGITKPLAGALDGVLGPWGQRLSETFSTESVKASVEGWASGLVSSFGTASAALGPVFSGLKDAVSGFVEGFGGMDALVSAFSGVLPLLLGPLGLLKDALMQVFGGGGVDMRAMGQELGASLAPVLQTLGQVAGVISGALGQALASLLPVIIQVGGALASSLGSVLTQLAPILGNLASAVLPIVAQLFAAIVPVIGQLAAAILPLVGMLVSQLAPVFLEIVSALLPPLTLLLGAVVSVVSTLVAALAPVVTALVSQLAPILVTLISALLPPLARVIAMVAEIIATVLAPILNVIINVLGVLLVGAINALLPIVGVVFGFIARTIGNAMDVISGIIRLVMAIVRGDWDGAWQAIQQIGAAVWDQIKNVISTAINLVVTIVTGALTILQTIWNAVWEVIKAVLAAAWNWIVSTITAAKDLVIGIINLLVSVAVAIFNGWRDTIVAIVTALKDMVVNVWNVLRDTVVNTVKALVDAVVNNFNSFRDTIAGIATTIKDWVVQRFEDLRAGATDLFQRMVDGIGRIWDGLKAVASAPVRFVIDTVINNGIIKGWNDLVGLLKLDEKLKMSPLSVPGFIRGGVLPGSGTSRGDDMLVTNRAGQAVATVASGEPVLSRSMYARNRPAVDAILAGKTLPGFFMGGFMVTPGSVRPHAMPYYDRRYAADMGGGTGSPIYAWKDGQVAYTKRSNTSYGNETVINHAGGEATRYAHQSEILVAAQQIVKAGQLIGRIGYSGNVRPAGPAGAHLHFEIIGGNSPLGGDTGSGGGGLFSMAAQWLTDKLSAPVKALIDKIPGAGVFVDAAKGLGTKLLDAAVEKMRSLFPVGFDGAMSGATATGDMAANARLLMQAGKTLNVPARAMLIALMTAAQESSMGTNRTAMTRPNGDGDTGWFQQRLTRGDGTQAQLMDPLYSLGVFLNGVRVPAGYHVPGLYNKNWQAMGLGQAAQAVQVSAFPSAYDKWESAARKWMADFGYASGTTNATRGWHLVGEQGPELVRFRGGETVLDNADTKRELVRAGGGGDHLTVNVHTVDERRAAALVAAEWKWVSR